MLGYFLLGGVAFVFLAMVWSAGQAEARMRQRMKQGMVKPEELGRKIDPKNFIALVPVGAGKFVPIRLQFKNSTLAILAGPDKGEEGEEESLQIIGKIEETLAVDGVEFRAFKRESGSNQRVQHTDTLVIRLRSQEKPG